MSAEPSAILESPGAERNKGPIWDLILSPVVIPALQQTADDSGKTLKVLEVAAGTGVHTHHFLTSLLSMDNPPSKIDWHPSDPDHAARASLDARAEQSGWLNGGHPHVSQISATGWVLGAEGGTSCQDGASRATDGGTVGNGEDGLAATAEGMKKYSEYFDLILCINMIHIAPWEATLGLLECASRVLRKGGILVTYGAYKVGGTAVESNLKFDEALRSKNPAWGVRNLEDVVEAANKRGLELIENGSVEMPSNNMGLLLQKV